jgi:hypothetical protein
MKESFYQCSFGLLFEIYLKSSDLFSVDFVSLKNINEWKYQYNIFTFGI